MTLYYNVQEKDEKRGMQYLKKKCLYWKEMYVIDE